MSRGAAKRAVAGRDPKRDLGQQGIVVRCPSQSELAERRPDITPACWLRKKTGSTDVFGRLWWDRPAYTIRTEFYKPEKGRYLHPSEHRPITVREAARCMSFSDEFVFPEHQPMTAVAKQIGNAVCPALARQIAEVVAAHLQSANHVMALPA